MNDEPKTYSIALRIRRVTYEDAYVTVPVTEAILDPQEDGTARLNVEAFLAEAVRISQDPRMEWDVEERRAEPHPTQQPRPEDRTSFDPAPQVPQLQ